MTPVKAIRVGVGVYNKEFLVGTFMQRDLHFVGFLLNHNLPSLVDRCKEKMLHYCKVRFPVRQRRQVFSVPVVYFKSTCIIL